VFKEMLRVILGFCYHDTADQWKRCLACGVCPFGTGIAVNTSVLAALVNRSKSCVNALLVEIGVEPIPITQSQVQALGCILHISDHAELRRWTIRGKLQEKDTEIKAIHGHAVEQDGISEAPDILWKFPDEDWMEPWVQ
jgi:uncharacterized protein YbcC (UPF0753/DUF2309 family)